MEKKKTQKTTTLSDTIPKSNHKIIVTNAKSILLTHIHVKTI